MKLTIKGHSMARILFSFQNLELLKTKSVRKFVPVPPPPQSTLLYIQYHTLLILLIKATKLMGVPRLRTINNIKTYVK